MPATPTESNAQRVQRREELAEAAIVLAEAMQKIVGKVDDLVESNKVLTKSIGHGRIAIGLCVLSLLFDFGITFWIKSTADTANADSNSNKVICLAQNTTNISIKTTLKHLLPPPNSVPALDKVQEQALQNYINTQFVQKICS